METIPVEIAMLKKEVENIKDTISNHAAALASIDSKVDVIASHLDKQNGTLPHMQTDLAELAIAFRAFTSKATETEIENARSAGKNGTRLKILWSALLLVAGAGAKYLLGMIT